ncbi:hypothetical protein [Agromyces sp. NPDC058104]|uniref:hypothetical protein n=1 Tax=Agromyces sp. NPDC058104 TaxID=3346342 RepID=UPI0036DE14AB
MDRRDLPQIGPVVVEREALAEAGEPLSAVLARFEVPAPTSDATPGGAVPPPAEGWRVLHRDRGLVIGAPTDDTRRSWRIARVEPPSAERPVGRVDFSPDELPLRPSQAERGRGLRLRWPDVTSSAPDLERLWIDIVNEGDEPWMPDGDGFHVAAAIVRPGHEGVGFAFVAGRDGACPLGSGDYARVRVHLDLNGLDRLEPGEYEVHAWLVDLSIRTEDPLRIELSPELIARRRAEVAARPASPAPHDQAAHLRTRISMLRALVSARDHLPELAELVLGHSGDSEQLAARIAELLGSTTEDAMGITVAQLRRFAQPFAGHTETELRGLEQRLAELER